MGILRIRRKRRRKGEPIVQFAEAHSDIAVPARETIYLESVEAAVDWALSTLPEREALAIRLRFGLRGPEHTCKQIGEQFGVSTVRAHQIVRKGLRRLAHPYRELKPFLYSAEYTAPPRRAPAAPPRHSAVREADLSSPITESAPGDFASSVERFFQQQVAQAEQWFERAALSYNATQKSGDKKKPVPKGYRFHFWKNKPASQSDGIIPRMSVDPQILDKWQRLAGRLLGDEYAHFIGWNAS